MQRYERYSSRGICILRSTFRPRGIQTPSRQGFTLRISVSLALRSFSAKNWALMRRFLHRLSIAKIGKASSNGQAPCTLTDFLIGNILQVVSFLEQILVRADLLWMSREVSGVPYFVNAAYVSFPCPYSHEQTRQGSLEIYITERPSHCARFQQSVSISPLGRFPRSYPRLQIFICCPITRKDMQ